MSPVNCQSVIDKERCRESIVLHEVGSAMEENVLFFPEPENVLFFPELGTQLSRPRSFATAKEDPNNCLSPG